MNLNTLTTVTQQFINDSNGTRYQGLYTQALNLAQQQFAIDSKCLWKDTTYTVASGTATYTLPTDFLWEKMVMLNGLPLQPTTRRELALTHPGSRWDTIAGTPTAYNIDPDAGHNDILLFPIPGANDAGNSLVLTYYCYPTDMAAVTDIPLNGNALLTQFHLGLAAWAGWYLVQAEDSAGSMQTKKQDLMAIYNDMVSQCVNTFKNTVSAPLRLRGVRNYTR